MSRPRILIADDEQHIVSLLSMTLRRSGFEVLTADNGEKALQLAEAFAVDLLVVDHTMPGLSGFELADRLSGSMPVLMVTARPELSESDRARVSGVIHKPFSPTELVARVKGLIGGAGQTKEHSI